jgi:hypothetical protein
MESKRKSECINPPDMIRKTENPLSYTRKANEHLGRTIMNPERISAWNLLRRRQEDHNRIQEREIYNNIEERTVAKNTRRGRLGPDYIEMQIDL